MNRLFWVVTLALLIPLAFSVPALPYTLAGDVFVDGFPAEIGTIIDAVDSENNVLGSFAIEEIGKYGPLNVDGESGKTVFLALNGILTGQSFVWSSGEFDYSYTIEGKSEGSCVDCDNDGFADDLDCNDNNNKINPEAEEICDDIDNNCDGFADEVCDEFGRKIDENSKDKSSNQANSENSGRDSSDSGEIEEKIAENFEEEIIDNGEEENEEIRENEVEQETEEPEINQVFENCITDWICTGWRSCVNEIEERTCVDWANCHPDFKDLKDKTEFRDCTKTENTEQEIGIEDERAKSELEGNFFYVNREILLVLGILLLLGLFFGWLRHK